MQPGLDYVAKNYNQYNTVLLTDGYLGGETLKTKHLRKKLLIISIGERVNIREKTSKVKQIVVKAEDNEV